MTTVPAVRRPSRLREAMPTWLARLLILAAVVSLFGLWFQDTWIYFLCSVVLGMFVIPNDPSLFQAALLFVLAAPIGRRYRGAHTILLSLMAFITVLSVLLAVILVGGFLADELQDITLFEKVMSAVMAVTNVVATTVVAWARPAFPVRMRARSVRNGALVLFAGETLAFLVTLGLLGPFDRHEPWAKRVRLAVNVTFGAQPDTATWQGPHWVLLLGSLMAGASVVAAFYVLWRAEVGVDGMSADDELRLRALIRDHGEDDSLSYFATRREKSLVFSPDGRAVVAYRVQGDVAVASGDPIGERKSWPAAVDAFLSAARLGGRHVTVLSTTRVGAELYASRGLTALTLGDEAVLHTDEFTLAGPAMRSVRHAVGRLERAGYTVEFGRFGDIPADVRATAADLADAWREGSVERGFSMALGRLRDRSDDRAVLVLARDGKGSPRALLTFAPWGRRGLSLDLMRRAPEAENGVTEFMVASLMRHAEGLGIRRVSLNFAMFRQVFSGAEQVGAGPMTRLSNKVLLLASRFYQLDSLYRSNDKYGPQWSPRLMCYDPGLTLTRAAWAMGIAEGFIPWPGRQAAEVVGARDAAFVERVHAIDAEPPLPALPASRRNEQQRVREEKAQRMALSGRETNPVAVPRTHSVAEARGLLATALEEGPTGDRPASGGRLTEVRVSVAGRVRALRDLGGITFAVFEEAGQRLQVVVERACTEPAQRDDFRRWVDLGDVISVTGRLGTSRSGEWSLWASSWEMAAKCFNPMPGIEAQLTDDARARQRVLDLITSDTSLEFLRKRGLGVQALRQALVAEGYLEVETPMLQPIHGGAAARPFVTHINAYDMELYLRIAPELFLKRLLVGGMERIFEVGRNFRNEGADATHNPEFTACEVYAAYSDYDEMRELTRRLILAMAQAVHGAPIARRPDGHGGYVDVDLSEPWPVVTVHEAVSRACGVPLTAASSVEEVAAACRAHDIPVAGGASAGELVMELYGALVEKQTQYPTFYCDFPREVSPLARPHRSVPGLTEQWDLVAFGAELGCAYSELADPIDQTERLTAQSLAAAAGDPEAMQLDEDFLQALRYGMPPTGGLGLGVDRIVMLLLGRSIRATLAFPFVRPQA